MQEVYIPHERARLLAGKGAALRRLEKLCGCTIRMGQGSTVELDGEPYGEYVARNVIYAFGRGFDLAKAQKLAGDNIYFASLDIGSHASKKRVMNVRSRLIGEDGRAKRYIEAVSGALMSVYGDTVSFIGRAEEIEEAETAARTIIEGGSHRLAYSRMEAAHRKHKLMAEALVGQ